VISKNIVSEEAIARVALHHHVNKIKKVKAIPIQTWTGPWGSRRLRLPDFKTITT
jgi:hypothetical protein